MTLEEIRARYAVGCELVGKALVELVGHIPDVLREASALLTALEVVGNRIPEPNAVREERQAILDGLAWALDRDGVTRGDVQTAIDAAKRRGGKTT